ncbi:MAG: toxin-antitoxin system YwqK family antitoxin [Bacteroidales bacterium]
MKRLLILFLFLTLLAACRQNKRNRHTLPGGDLLFEEFYSNGQLKSSKHFFNEAMTDYLYLAYYENGELMDSVAYDENVPEGKRVFFHQSSGIRHVEHYENGVLNGVNTGIYENGVRNYEGYRKAGEKVGEWFFRSPEGVNLTYEFYDSTGQLVYFRKYDEGGRYQKSNGEVLINAGFTNNQIDSGDSIFTGIVAAVPPGCESKLNVYLVHEQMEDTVIISRILASPRHEFGLPVSQPGMYKMAIQLTVTDLLTGKTEESKVEKKLTVRDN